MKMDKYSLGDNIIILLLSLVVNGFAVKLMWNWFIAPLGSTDITLLHGIGLALIVALISDNDNKKSDKSQSLLFDMLKIGSFILIGFIVKSMM